MTIVLLSYVLDAASYRWTWAAKILKSKPVPLIVDGRINVRTARRELLSREEIRSHLWKRGVEGIQQVRRAYVEPDKSISVIGTDEG